NLSQNKTNIKKSSPLIEEISNKVSNTSSFSKQSLGDDRERKREADILSRPSVFFDGKRKRQKESPGKVSSRPDPNPRVKKVGGESDEKDYDQNVINVNAKVVGDDDYNDEDDDDDPLKPQTVRQD